MTSVSITYDAAGYIRQISAQGHAGYADEGEDIVCAAVSALTQTAAIAVAKLGSEPVIDEEAASIQIILPRNLQLPQMRDIQAILFAIRDGLLAIEKQYSNHIAIKEV